MGDRNGIRDNSAKFTARPRRWSDEEVIQAYGRGMDADEIGAAGGMSYQTARKILHANNVPLRPPNRSRRITNDHPEVDELEVVRLYQNGSTGPEIARALRTNRRRVYQILERHGIARRSSRAQLTERHRARKGKAGHG